MLGAQNYKTNNFSSSPMKHEILHMYKNETSFAYVYAKLFSIYIFELWNMRNVNRVWSFNAVFGTVFQNILSFYEYQTSGNKFLTHPLITMIIIVKKCYLRCLHFTLCLLEWISFASIITKRKSRCKSSH